VHKGRPSQKAQRGQANGTIEKCDFHQGTSAAAWDAFDANATGAQQGDGMIGLGRVCGFLSWWRGKVRRMRFRLLKKLGITAVQGHDYARPVPVRDLAETLDGIAQRVRDQKQAA
jgi:hypothetical protein